MVLTIRRSVHQAVLQAAPASAGCTSMAEWYARQGYAAGQYKFFSCPRWVYDIAALQPSTLLITASSFREAPRLTLFCRPLA